MNKKAILKFLGAVCVIVLVCTTFFGYTPVVNVFDSVDELKEKYPQFSYLDLSNCVKEAENLVGGSAKEYEIIAIHDRNAPGCVFTRVDERAVAGLEYRIVVSNPNGSTKHSFSVATVKEGSKGMFTLVSEVDEGFGGTKRIVNIGGIEIETECMFDSAIYDGTATIFYVGYAKFIADNQTFYVRCRMETIFAPIYTEESFVAYFESMIADAVINRTIGTLAEG